MHLRHVTRLLVTSLLISSVIGGLPYGAKPIDCYPKTVFVTVAQDVTREVAVPTRIFKSELVPKRFDLDRINSVTEDVIVRSYRAQPVTTTVHQAVVELVTVYDYKTITKQHPVVATIDSNVPVPVTVTDWSNVISYSISTGLVQVTDVVPVYQTTLEIVLDTIKNTKVVPVISTVWDTKIVYSTLCPKLYY